MNLKIDYNLKYADFVKDIKTLKRQYNELLMSFSVFEYHEKVQCMARCKKQIYALNYQEYLKDRIWLYLNDYLDYKTFQNLK